MAHAFATWFTSMVGLRLERASNLHDLRFDINIQLLYRQEEILGMVRALLR